MDRPNQVKRMAQTIHSNQTINATYMLTFWEIWYFVDLGWETLDRGDIVLGNSRFR